MKLNTKKKKRMRAWAVVFVFCVLPFCGTVNASAEVRGDVPVTYTKEESDVYTLKVEVKGDGEVICGLDTIRNTTKEYDLPVDENITFDLKPDRDSSIKKVVLNDENITGKVKNNFLKIEGTEKEQLLSITFDEKAESGIFGPKTGDSAKIFPFILLIVIALMVIVIICHFKWKKNISQMLEQENGEKENGEA